jgi:hypothetical protein
MLALGRHGAYNEGMFRAFWWIRAVYFLAQAEDMSKTMRTDPDHMRDSMRLAWDTRERLS